MGLDIHHLYATTKEDPSRFCRVEQFLGEMQPRRRFFRQHKNRHVDWEYMFAKRGLVYSHYRLLSRASKGKYMMFAFVDADSPGVVGPVRVIFSNELRMPFGFLQRSRFPDPDTEGGSEAALRVFGQFGTLMKAETVVFYQPVGHQKDGVSEAFFQEFKPDDLTCSRQRVDLIYDRVLPEAREDFKRDFLDKWDETRSFVLISW
jgi:hypothetical protein